MSNYGFTSAGTSYDDEDRLTGFARASGTFTQSWNLTSVGDLNSVTTNGTAQNRTHGPTHELLTAGGQSVTTDVKGNITLLPTTLTTSGVAMAVGYDFDNKLKSADVDNNGSSDVTFQYDALGRRVARLGTGGSLVFVQHDQQTIADYGYSDPASSPLYRYVYASYIDEPVVRKGAGTGGTIHYLHRNQQYSVTAVTTSTGSVAERYAYTAYGQPTFLDASGTPLTTQTSKLNARYLYTGREWDATLGLYHFRARWMSGLAGRFLGRDPIGYEDDCSTYSYTAGGPITWRDPHGTYRLAGSGPPKSTGNPRHSSDVCVFRMAGTKTGPANYPPNVDVHDVSFDPYEIIEVILRKKCCHVLLFGHQGGTNGGISSQPKTDPPEGSFPKPTWEKDHWWLPVFPNTDLEKRIGQAFKDNKCKSCKIFNYACAVFDEDDRDEFNRNRQNIANNTGCSLIGLYGEYFRADSKERDGVYNSANCDRWGYNANEQATCSPPKLYVWLPQTTPLK